MLNLTEQRPSDAFSVILRRMPVGQEPPYPVSEPWGPVSPSVRQAPSHLEGFGAAWVLFGIAGL